MNYLCTAFECSRCEYAHGFVEDETFSHHFGTWHDPNPAFVLEVCDHPIQKLIEKLNLEKDFEKVLGELGKDYCPKEIEDDIDQEIELEKQSQEVAKW